ncbi:MAG: hypothetical protein ABIP55_16100 [Tepidisphaeraceae bacterium]
MSRGVSGEVRTIAATNNVYTALAAAAVVLQVIGLIVLFLKGNEVGGLFP